MRPTIGVTRVALIGAVFAFDANPARAAEFAVPPEKCDSAWSMVTPGDAIIEEGAAETFIFSFTMVDSNEDGTIEKHEFKKACAGGLILADEETVKDLE